MTTRRQFCQGLGTVLAGAAVPMPPSAITVTPPFITGIGRSINDSAAVTPALGWLGVGAMRVDAPWRSIETAPGQYAIPAWLETAVDATRAQGIEPLLILAYGNPIYGEDKPRTRGAINAFTRYAAFVVRHFAGRVRYFDLWNEWDAPTGRTTPMAADTYVALARSVYPAVKAENADALVLSGGLSDYGLLRGWLERFIELGGLSLVDGLSLHPYNYFARNDNLPEHAVAMLDRAHELALAAGRPLPIYVTEMGYPAFGGPGGVSQEAVAAYMARFILYSATRPHIAGVWWYCLRDQGTNPEDKEHHFGVFDAAMQPKPAAYILRDLTALLRALPRWRDESDGPARRISATRADGTTVRLEWRDNSPPVELLNKVTGLAATYGVRPG